MAIAEKRYLDYPGLNAYDELIKEKITNDIESLGSFLESEFNQSYITEQEISDLFEE